MIDFSDALQQGGRAMGLEFEPAALERLAVHQRLLLRWADKVNLTTVREPRAMAERLYLDSAVLVPALDAGARVHDVGSGAGFPGLVIKALRPELVLTLTEARRKRVSFLRQAARAMGLGSGIEIRWQRLGWETGGREPQPGDRTEPIWDEVVSRATLPPPLWVEQGSRLVAPGGRLWIMAGQPHGSGDARADWRAAGLPAGFSLEREQRYRLPFCGLERWLVALRRAPE